MNSRTLILAACRTPIGKLLGSLSHLTAVDLGVICAREAIARAGVDPNRYDEAIVGNVLAAGLGQAPARQVALRAGLTHSVAAVTINKVCGSGLKAVMLADQAIRAGDARVILAGGIESMSRAPHLMANIRSGIKLGDQQLTDSMIHDGLWCSFEGWHMGKAAEHIARKHGISRSDQDALAAESHRRAVAAIESGAFDSEIVEVPASKGGAGPVVRRDEGPRSDTSADRLGTLKPAFDPEGSVTAGNASMISDGAAMIVVADGESIHGGSPAIARIVATAVAGVAPKELFIAPVPAIRRVLDKAELAVNDIDLWEINEAFAAQMLACIRELNLDPARVNVHGGAMALGHPIGASGARVLVTLLHALDQRGGRFGVASLCLGGGNAVAMVVERIKR